MVGNFSTCESSPILDSRDWCTRLLASLLLLSLSSIAHANTNSEDSTESADGNAQTSLFDELFSDVFNDAIEYQIPYPFEQLIRSLSNKLQGCNSRGRPPYAAVLVPVSRSQLLDPDLAESFRFPRIILGIDTESCERPLSKDRLFLAYQEISQTIEVISYNERRGRFEFQLVENYNERRTPTVRYAQRENCIQCHQNGAAIFPQFNWTETNFNQRIAAAIGKHHRKFHGIGTDQLSAKAGRLDGSTDRANLFTAYQKIWRDGCTLATRAESLECRAGVFESLLKRRLGFANSDAGNDSDINSFRRRVSRNWQSHWPNGLPIPNPDLPSLRRDSENARSDLNDDRDPRTTRPPRAFWHPLEYMDRALDGMADTFLSQGDINRLDVELSTLSSRSRGYRQSYQGACVFDRVRLRGDTWIDANCEVSAGDLNKSRLAVQLYLQSSNIVHPTLSGMYLTDSSPGFITHAKLSGTVKIDPNGVSTAMLSARKRYQVIRARSRDGQAMSALEFAWDERFAEPIPGGLRYPGRIRLILEKDGHILTTAIEQMVEDARSSRFDGFDDKPLRGVTLMDALFEKLAPTRLGQLSQVTLPATLIVAE